MTPDHTAIVKLALEGAPWEVEVLAAPKDGAGGAWHLGSANAHCGSFAYNGIEAMRLDEIARTRNALAAVADERDALAKLAAALGFTGDRLTLAIWALGKGMEYDRYNDDWCYNSGSGYFTLHAEGRGYWTVEGNTPKSFAPGSHELAHAAFLAAGGGAK